MNFEHMLSRCDVIIRYDPLIDEVDVNRISFFRVVGMKSHILPNDRNANPFAVATDLRKLYSNNRVCIIVPGQKFDVFGNRKGRGGGWYDRFLSSVPSEWVRVGVVSQSRLSQETIRTNSWDEPMDWIISVDKFSNSFVSILCPQSNRDHGYLPRDKKSP